MTQKYARSSVFLILYKNIIYWQEIVEVDRTENTLTNLLPPLISVVHSIFSLRARTIHCPTWSLFFVQNEKNYKPFFTVSWWKIVVFRTSKKDSSVFKWWYKLFIRFWRMCCRPDCSLHTIHSKDCLLLI